MRHRSRLSSYGNAPAAHKAVALLENARSVRRTTLPNGLRVITEDVPSAFSAAVGVWIDVGSGYETPALNGISHFAEHAVFKGTHRRSAKEIASLIESKGGYINAFTGKEHTCYYARVLANHLPLALDILSDIVLNPVLRHEDIELEKGVILEEIKNIQDTPEDLIFDEFDSVLFDAHPFAMPVIGTEKSVGSFTSEQIADFIEQFYTQRRIVVSVAGKCDHDEIVELCSALFAGRRRSTSGKKIIPPVRSTSVRHLKRFKPIRQVYHCQGRLTFGYTSKHKFPLLFLSAIFGEGMSSRLFQSVRENHALAYTVYSFVHLMNFRGIFGIFLGTDDSRYSSAIDLVAEEIRIVREKGITEAEFRRAQEQVVGGFLLGLENLQNRMTRTASADLYTGEIPPLHAVLDELYSVRRNDLEDLIPLLFDENSFTALSYLPLRKKRGAPSDHRK